MLTWADAFDGQNFLVRQRFSFRLRLITQFSHGELTHDGLGPVVEEQLSRSFDRAGPKLLRFHHRFGAVRIVGNALRGGSVEWASDGGGCGRRLRTEARALFEPIAFERGGVVLIPMAARTDLVGARSLRGVEVRTLRHAGNVFSFLGSRDLFFGPCFLFQTEFGLAAEVSSRYTKHVFHQGPGKRKLIFDGT